MKVGLRFLLVGALIAVLAWFTAYALVLPPAHGFFDLTVYRGAARWWLDHRSLYSFIRPGTSKGFTYPPFAVLCLLPTAMVSQQGSIVLVTAVSSVLVVVTTWWLVDPVARRRRWSRWFAVALAVPLVFAMEPVRETLAWGQVNLVLVALVLADVRALQRRRRWAGVGIGLASAIKLTPGLFVVYLALSGRIRAAATAAGTFLAATLVAFVLDPSSSAGYWTGVLFDTGRVGRVDRVANQSVLGALARVAYPSPPDRRVWLLFVAALLAVGLWRARHAARRGDELTGIAVTGLLTCLISPISWTHHLYWVVPAAVVLVDVAAGTPVGRRAPAVRRWADTAVRAGAGVGAAAVATAFVVSLVWFFDVPLPGRQHDGGVLGMLGENSYLLIMIVLVLLLPVRAEAEGESAGNLHSHPPLSGAGPSSARSSAPARPAESSPR